MHGKYRLLHDIPCCRSDFRLVPNDYEPFCFYFIVWKIVIYKPKNDMANFSIVVVPTKKLSNGRHRIRIAVAHHSQTRYISTQFTLDSANQLKNGRVVRHENAANMNACLRKLINEYEEIVTSISYLPAISCTELIRIITYEQKKKGITFQAVAKEYMNFMKGEEREKSYKLYKIASERLVKYMKGDFPLIQLTPIHIQGFSLYFLLDWRYGGKVLSQTQAEMDLYGVSEITADARDRGYVMLEGQQIDNVKGFYKNVVGGRAGVTEYYMYDATNLRLREVSLSYNFSKKWIQKTKVLKDVQLSFVARNLCFLYKKAPFDPDLVLSTGNDNQGIEVFGMPTTRSLGFTLKCEF